MVLLSLPTIDPKRWWVMPDPSVVANSNDGATFDSTGFFISLPIMANIRWRPLLNNLFWNLNSFDVGASFAGEVHDPDRVFPRAMFLSVIFVIFSYLLPLLAALGAIESEQSDWDAGYFTHVAIKIGGSWLGVYTVLAAGISNIALFEAEMSGDAYQLMGMADRGLIPKWFTKRSRFGTPVNGIITGTIVIILMSVADFDQLVEMLNFAYSLSILLEYAAFIKLRFSDDDGTSQFLCTCFEHCYVHSIYGIALTIHLILSCVSSSSSLQSTTQHIRMHLHAHPTVVVLIVSTGNCIPNDIYLFCIFAGVWYRISIFPKSRQTL